MKTTCLAAIPMLLCPVFAMAQSTQGGPATEMWGVGTNVSGTTDASGSAYMHYYNSLIASAANAAEKKLLLSTGMNMTIQAIGSQSIVSTTIYGDGNQVDNNATQTTTNDGSVNTSGSVGFPNGN